MQFRRSAALFLLCALLVSACGDSEKSESTPSTTAPAAGALTLRSTAFAAAPWGPAVGQLGRTNTQEQGVQIPLSLTVAPDGTVYVLDQVNKRISPVRAGTWLDPIPLPAGANITDIVYAATTLWAFDQGTSQAWKLTETGWSEPVRLTLPKLPVLSSFWFDGSTNAIYVRNPDTGDDYPVISNGLAVLPIDQKPRQGAGAYLENGNLTVRTQDGAVTPVNLQGKVNETTDVSVDPTGSVWMFAGVQEGDKEPYLVVVRVDGTTHGVLSQRVDVTTAGDMTRRLALAPPGAIVMSSNPDAVVLQALQAS